MHTNNQKALQLAAACGITAGIFGLTYAYLTTLEKNRIQRQLTRFKVVFEIQQSEIRKLAHASTMDDFDQVAAVVQMENEFLDIIARNFPKHV